MVRQTHHKKNKQGMTLIEVLIYVFLLTIVLSLVTNLLFQTASYRVNHQIEASLFQNSFLVSNKLRQDLKKASQVDLPSDENFSSSLVLQTAEGQITYQEVDDFLQRNGVGLTDDKVEVNLDPPERGFRKIGATIQIKIALTAKQKPFGLPQKTRDYQTTIVLNQ